MRYHRLIAEIKLILSAEDRFSWESKNYSMFKL